MEKDTLTREELYHQVWSTPMTALSKMYGMPDHLLRMVCQGMEIPLPKSGHWQKIRTGKTVPAPALPSTYTGENAVNLRQVQKAAEEAKAVKSPLQVLQGEIDQNHAQYLKIPNKLKNPERYILAAKEDLETRYKNYMGNELRGTSIQQLDIRVSREQVTRALCFMDALIKILSARGHRIVIGHRETYVRIKEEEIQIGLREKQHRTMVKGKHWDTAEYTPSGLLVFKMGERWKAKEWTDGNVPLEQRLSLIVASLEMKAKEELEQRIAREKAWEVQREKERIQRELEARQEQELAKFKKLLQEAQRWKQLQVLRAYIHDTESLAAADTELNKERASWLQWAREKADWYDPQVNRTDELLANVDKETLTLKKRLTYSW